MDQKEISILIQTFHFLMSKGFIEAIDQIFFKSINDNWQKNNLDYNKVLIVTFCRANYSYKDKLKYYEDFLEKSINYLIANNEDPNDLLHGII